MKMGRRVPWFVPLITVVCIVTVVLHFPRKSLLGGAAERVDNKPQTLYNIWANCIKPKMSLFKGNASQLWSTMGKIGQECDNPVADKLKIKSFTNLDETKYHILPKNGISTIISLGIGHDTRSEEELRRVLGNNSVEFFGADPMVEINEKLYSAFGHFFPFAIGAESKISTASVLDGTSYRDKLVVHLDIIYFLSQYVRRQLIDNLWLDAEGAEYEMFPFFYRNGKFDENGFVFCQINMEIHLPNEEQKKLTHDFLFRILEDERYAIFYVLRASHMRLFLVNFDDFNCRNKYLPQSN